MSKRDKRGRALPSFVRMGQSLPTEWKPFAEACAMQRFHCLGRMHPLVMSVPRHVNVELRHPGLIERLKRESRIIVEFQSFHELAIHLDDIFNFGWSILRSYESFHWHLSKVPTVTQMAAPCRSIGWKRSSGSGHIFWEMDGYRALGFHRLPPHRFSDCSWRFHSRRSWSSHWPLS